MAPRPGPPSQEGYPSSSPSSDAHQHDPFSPPPPQQRYYDNDSEFDYSRRDVYSADIGPHPAHDGNYYDHNNVYDSYRQFSSSLPRSTHSAQPSSLSSP